IVFIGQLLAATGQPYVLNCWSKLGTNWFLEKEKATSVGLGELSIFTGIIIAMLFPIEDVGPIITLWIYAIIGLISMLLYLIFTRDKPENPPNEFAIKEVKISSTKGMKDIMFKNKDFLLLFFVIFIGLGIFNAITTEIDSIFNDAYYPNVDSGTVSALMILGGVLGSIILSQISDQLGKRKIFLILALFGGVLFSILMAIFKEPSEIYFFSALYGFLLVACLPIGLTYGAEITYPYPEETSAGLLMTGGQISGIIFLFFPLNMYLYFCAALFLIGLILTFFLRDTKEIKEEKLKKEQNKE
ncbi:MAG: MFS transporter, partial [Promethearchaeota archaeon]